VALNKANKIPNDGIANPFINLNGNVASLGETANTPNRGGTEVRPTNPLFGDQFYDTTTNILQVFTTNGWVAAATKPDAPTNITVTSSQVPFGGLPGARVSWSTASTSVPASSYTVTSNTGGFTATTTGREVTFLGLTAGTAYTFTVSAINTYGSSSATSASVTPTTLPQEPAAVSATITDATGYVAITAPTNTGAAAISSYVIIANPGNITTTTSSGATGTYRLSGLTIGTTYTFSVYSVNAVGRSLNKTDSSPATAALIPVTSGLVGRYIASSLSTGTNQWLDVSGNANHAAVGGSPTVVLNSAAFGSTGTFETVQGANTDSILWPAAILPSTYTLFYVARYNTANSSTAATQLNFQAGTTTTGGMTPGTGGASSISSVNGEWRMQYTTFETGDSIWAGEYTVIDNSTITANGQYIISFECRSDNAQLSNGTSSVGHVWDSAAYEFQYGDNPIMSTDRRFCQIHFGAGATFALGNRWVRGMNKSGLTYGPTTAAFFRNWYAYRTAQQWCNMIFTGADRTWYSGFWAGHAGSAYHGNTLLVANTHSNNWVKGTDQNAGGSGTLFRTNGVDRYNAALPTFAGTTNARLAVNNTIAQSSNFQIAEVIVFNRTLNATEYGNVETYLAGKYGV
jgi:hypothetical protein